MLKAAARTSRLKTARPTPSLSGKRAKTVKITEENKDLYRRIPELEVFAESYRNEIILKLLEHHQGKSLRKLKGVL